MRIVSLLGEGRLVRGRLKLARQRAAFYRWEDDFPIHLQESHPKGESSFRLEFSLTKKERSEFKRRVGSTLNESLPIEIKIGKDDPSFKVVKQGPGSQELNEKSQVIAAFIGRRVEVNYIPAVRTANAAVEVVQRMLTRELAALEADPEYKRAFAKIAEIQEPTLERISREISSVMRGFLPNVKTVKVSLPEHRRYVAMRRDLEVMIDDGTPTPLSRKGDGVQSLAAISLLHGTASSGRSGSHLILALEEPESHLHPGAIHRLREVLEELSHKHQVVITSHCPLFVDRVNIGSNIVVTASKATPARSMEEVRNVLGVRASDNLRHAYVVLVVEGDSDSTIIKAVASAHSDLLSRSISTNTLAVESIGGAGNLRYKLSELQNSLCNSHCLLDNDEAGIGAIETVKGCGLASDADIHLATCPGMKSSELEDLINPSIYSEWVDSTYGVSLREAPFRNAKKKWSDRMADTFKDQGKMWDKSIEADIKRGVAQRVRANPRNSLAKQKSRSIQALFKALEQKLESSN